MSEAPVADNVAKNIYSLRGKKTLWRGGFVDWHNGAIVTNCLWTMTIACDTRRLVVHRRILTINAASASSWRLTERFQVTAAWLCF